MQSVTPKTILVLGAQGVLGRFTATALQAAGHRVLRGGRRAETASDFRLVDLDRLDTLVEALNGVDLVVSSIEDPQVRAEREILRRGGLLLSQATLPTPARRRLDAEFANGSTGTVILNVGLSGVGALVVRDLLERHPLADAVEIGYVVSTAGSAGRAGVIYVHRLLTAGPRLRTMTRLFAPPRGARACFDLSDNDEIWLSPRLSGARAVHAYMAIAEPGLSAFLMQLNRWGVLARLPRGLLTAGVSFKPAPKALTREPMRVRLAVYRDGTLLEAQGVDAEGDYNSTVHATVRFVQALSELDGSGVPAGMHGVEDIVRLPQLRDAFESDRLVFRPLAA